MTEFWITPDQMFDGKNATSGQSVWIVDDRIVDLAEMYAAPPSIKGCLTPGFVDLQANGGGGVLLNTTPTRDGMTKIAAAHRKFGTVAVMPTVITDHADVLDQAAEAAITAKSDAGIVGLYIEGPHISDARRGTHNRAHVRAMDARTMDVVARLRQNGVCVLITVAPESTTNDQIAALAKMGALYRRDIQMRPPMTWKRLSPLGQFARPTFLMRCRR